jgi:uncharacterized protein YpmB
MTKTKPQVKEKSKLKKVIITILIIVAIIALVISSPFIYKAIDAAKKSEEKTLEALKEQKVDLEIQKNDEFFDNSFSKKYYELKDQLNDINVQITTLEASITFRYTFLPIIIIALIVVIGGISLVINIVVKDFQKMTPKLNHAAFRLRPYDKTILNRHDINPPTKLKPLKCPSCKANLEHGALKCEYCGTSVIKVKK